MTSWASPHAFLALVLVLGVFLLGSVVQRLFLSPLGKIPGPKLAAISGIWLWQRDLSGAAPKAIKDLHVKHGECRYICVNRNVLNQVSGPIVRIGPNEVSIDDGHVHNTVLYCQAPKFMKVGVETSLKSLR
jgi:hypothetical protein